MFDILMKNLKLIKMNKKNYRSKYAALCTCCGSILPFDIDTSISITVDEKDKTINRFKCRTANNAHHLYFTCNECSKLMNLSVDGIYKPVLVIPRDLAESTKNIINIGITVRNMSTSIVISPYIDLSNGIPEFYNIIPISGSLEIEGEEDSKIIYNLMKSIIVDKYNEIFGCIRSRIMNSEESDLLEDCDDERSLDDLNTPDDKKLYLISIYSIKHPNMPMKVKNESDIDYKFIEDRNNKFIDLVSTFSEALTNMINNNK